MEEDFGYEMMCAAVMDAMEQDIPPESIFDLCLIAEDADEFASGMQGSIDLWDVVRDYYGKQDVITEDET